MGVKKPAVKAPQDISEACLHAHCKQYLDKAGIFNKVLLVRSLEEFVAVVKRYVDN